jgi:outer membrane autotransporter protein
MKVGDQSYDSLRYEVGVDTVIPSTTARSGATPYFKLAYVYDDADNSADVNGDSIDNGERLCGACRSGYTVQLHQELQCLFRCNYLGGGDVEQNWGANVGVKYTW